MNKETGNIEDVFKETFEGFEADVSPDLWNNIQHGIKPYAAAGKTAGSKILVKLLAGATIVGGIAAGYYIYNNKTISTTVTNNEQINNRHKQITQSAETDKNIADKSPSGSGEITTTPISANKKSIKKDKNFLAPDETVSVAAKGEQEIGEAESNKFEEENSKNLNAENKTKESDILSLPPKASIKADYLSGDAPLIVSFSNDGNGASYEWDFDDGKQISKFQTPTRVFDKPGEYKVTLTVRDNKNNISRDYVTIKVKSATLLYPIPTIFTPNGDSKNDRFEVKGEGIKSIEGTIIDPQTGNTIYQWYMPNDFWNGKRADNSDAPEGNYYYIIRYIGADDKTIEKKGIVKLKR